MAVVTRKFRMYLFTLQVCLLSCLNHVYVVWGLLITLFPSIIAHPNTADHVRSTTRYQKEQADGQRRLLAGSIRWLPTSVCGVSRVLI